MASESDLPDEVLSGDGGQGIQFEVYWRAILRRWRLVALVLGVALAIAVVYSILAQPQYRAAAILDVEPESATALDIASIQTFYGRGPEYLATQARLMRTREIAERVAKRLKLVEDRQFNPPESGFFKSDEKPTPESQLARVVGQLQKTVSASPVREVGVTTRDTNLVQLSAIAPTRRLAADIANAFADAFLDWNLESKYGIAGRASGYLADQIQKTKNELDQKTQALLAYAKAKGIVSSDPQANLDLERGGTSNYDAAVADRVAKEARYHEVETARPDVIADTLSNGLVSQLRAEQARLERDYAEKLNLFKPEWPAMQQLKAQIDKGREHLEAVIGETVAKARETAKNDYMTALRKEESLKAALKSQKTETMQFSTDVVGYNNLKLEVDTTRTLLDTLLKRQAELEVMARLGRDRESNIRIAERARPPSSPYKPSYKLNGLVALFLGGGFGVGLALLLDFLDRSLRTSEQVEKYIQLPVLGIIPAFGSAAGKGYGYVPGRKHRRKRELEEGEEEPTSVELLPHRQPRSRIAERYRAFRTALLLSRAGGVKSIVFTSSFSQEGKTASAVNLAVVLGQLGRRVLLVDADLHRPRLHEVFRISNRAGLVSVLAQDLSPDRAVAKTEVPDVFVVPSGPLSPNPSGLLSSDAMNQFLEFGRLNFDYVILDAPPVSAVADVFILGHRTDGVVLCLQGGKTPREHVSRARDMLSRNNVRVLGVLINNLVEDAGGYGAFGHDERYYGEQGHYGEDKREASALRTL
jgi:capsular exopolysaccharide synthesis family protein